MAAERSAFSEVPPMTDCQPPRSAWPCAGAARGRRLVGSQLMGPSRVTAFPLVGFGADVVSGSSPSTIATPVLRASGTTYKPKTSAAVGSCSLGPRLTICVPLDVPDPGAREGLRASPAAQRIDIHAPGRRTRAIGMTARFVSSVVGCPEVKDQ
jgi:hypothetical protein